MSDTRLSPNGEYLGRQFRLYARQIEFVAGLPTAESLLEGARMVSQLCMDRHYPWADLREALADHPELQAEAPDVWRQVDRLPWGEPGFRMRGGRLERVHTGQGSGPLVLFPNGTARE